ncbi:unnamed protein product, partial [Polarella glacialis]
KPQKVEAEVFAEEGGLQAKTRHHGKGMLKQAVQNHVESFNAFLDSGLDRIVECMSPIEIEPWEGSEDPTIVVYLAELTFANPVNRPHKESDKDGLSAIEARQRWLPSDCRMAHSTYGGTLKAKFDCRLGNSSTGHSIDLDLGEMPVMIRSRKCNLYGLSPEELVACREDCTESGGYFLLHGLERVIRLLVMPRSNFPMAVTRSSYQSRGKLYTPHAVLMRCMRPDSTTLTNCLHYCKDG